MNFISLQFLLFFTIVCVLYYLIQHYCFREKLSQLLLLGASLCFYCFASIKFLPFLIFSFAVTFVFGHLVKKIKSLFIAAMIIDVLPLLFFKYVNFIISPFTSEKLPLILPLGISFITFQSLSYLADVRNGKIAVEKDPVSIFLFVSFFPVVSSGPIQRAENLIPQLKQKHLFEYNHATDGMKLFIWGLAKKVIIANSLASYVDEIYKIPSEAHGPALLLATFLYSFQIYCDFSGYSDMAIGVSKFLGFDVGKNFDHPYLSNSCGEFWKRWHISLSSWLRDYVYIPLGGSRVPVPRIYLNLIMTFLVSGIWHGAAWTFVVWGLIHGIYQCTGRLLKSINEKLPSALRIFITFCLISFAWIFFRVESLNDGLIIAKKIFCSPIEASKSLIELRPEIGTKAAVKLLFDLDVVDGYKQMSYIILKLLCFVFIDILSARKDGLSRINSMPVILRWIIYVIFLNVIVSNLLAESANSISTNFIYNNF